MSLINIATDTSKSTITNIREEDIQPNAYDVSLKAVYRISDAPCTVVRGQNTVHRGAVEVKPNEEGMYELPPGEYDILFDHKVSIAEGEAGWLIQRSSLNRNSIEIKSGLYDSGFSNWIGSRLTVKSGPFITAVGTPLAQFILTKAETTTLYNGQYNEGDSDNSVV